MLQAHPAATIAGQAKPLKMHEANFEEVIDAILAKDLRLSA